MDRIWTPMAILMCISFSTMSQNLTKEYINPGPGYTHVVVTKANGVKTIHVAGQVGEGNISKSNFVLPSPI